MALALLVAVFLGGGLLLAAAILLSILNYNEKLLGTVLSIVLGGTVAAIIAVASGLKETRLEQGFASSVVFDHGLTAFLPFDANAQTLSERLSTLASLGRPVTQKDGVTTMTIKPAESDDALFQHGTELLQYQVLYELHRIQRGGWAIRQTQSSVEPAVRIPIKVSRMSDVPGEEILRQIKGNRFANSDMARFQWEHAGHIPLPEGTTIRLVHEPTSPESGPEKRIVRLQKSWFFTIDIVVEGMGGSGPGSVPAGLAVPQEQRPALRTFNFKVLCRAKFELLTSGNWQTEEHKRWAEWLFGEIRNAMGD